MKKSIYYSVAGDSTTGAGGSATAGVGSGTIGTTTGETLETGEIPASAGMTEEGGVTGSDDGGVTGDSVEGGMTGDDGVADDRDSSCGVGMTGVTGEIPASVVIPAEAGIS